MNLSPSYLSLKQEHDFCLYISVYMYVKRNNYSSHSKDLCDLKMFSLIKFKFVHLNFILGTVFLQYCY